MERLARGRACARGSRGGILTFRIIACTRRVDYFLRWIADDFFVVDGVLGLFIGIRFVGVDIDLS